MRSVSGYGRNSDDVHAGPLGAEGGALLKLKADLAFLSVLLRGAALSVLLKANFDPNQPRDDRGRWAVDGGGGRAQGGLTRVAQAESTDRYRVFLHEEEKRGGHAIKKHVSQSDQDLIMFVKSQTYRRLFDTLYKKAEGTFDSIESANDFVNRLLEANKETVDQVANGTIPQAWIEMRFGYATGKEAFRAAADAEPYIRVQTHNQ